MNSKYLALTSLAAAMALTACGGGGGGDNNATSTGTTPANPPVTTTPTPAPTVTASAEGAYEGTVSNGLTHLSLVLEDDRIYSIYGNTVNGVFGVSRFLRGAGKSANGSYTASEVREYGSGASATPYTLKATYVSGSSLNGSLTNGTVNTTFTGAPLSNSTYVYNTPARLANISGAWNLTDLAGTKVALTIGADGKFTGTSGSCAITGSLTPFASGKNVFTFSLTAGPAPCAHPAEVTTGIAVEFTIGSVRQLMAAGTGTTLVNGTALIGAR